MGLRMKEEQKDIMGFKGFTPQARKKEDFWEIYSALDEAIENKEILNIALTGGYGSGKSTIINSYISEARKTDKTVNISLATFNLRANEDGTDTDNDGIKTLQHDLHDVELSILQQLIYHESASNLPLSKISRINLLTKIEQSNYYRNLAVTFISIALGIWIYYSLYKSMLRSPEEYSVFDTAFILLVSLTFILTPVFCWVWEFVKDDLFHKKIRLDKINLLKGEVSLEKDSEGSLLNSYLDEIIYFFNATDYELVVLEDLDRLEHLDIFIKLREINQLININRKDKKPIKFIYAVKDGIFLTPESRTKFFDFIIPVIPVLDFNNSYQLLKAELQRIPDKYKVSDIPNDFLAEISSFINDYRTLISIVNEFYFYLTTEQGRSFDRLELVKLLALMTYKNLMPYDFSLIKEKEGFLYSIIEDYQKREESELLQARVDTFNEGIRQLTEELMELEGEEHESLESLEKALYKELFFHLRGGLQETVADSIFNRFDEEVFPMLNGERELQEFRVDLPHWSRVVKTLTKEDLENYKKEYLSRAKLIQKKQEGRRAQIREEIMRLKRERQTVPELSEILKETKTDWINKYSQESEDDVALLAFLLRQGYIDETYPDYISLLHESSSETIRYRRMLLNNKSYEEVKDIQIPQPKIDDLLSQFNNFKNYVYSEAVLNHDVIHYLVTSKENVHKELLEKIIDEHFYNNPLDLLERLQEFYQLDYGVDFFKKVVSRDPIRFYNIFMGSAEQTIDKEWFVYNILRFHSIEKDFVQVLDELLEVLESSKEFIVFYGAEHLHQLTEIPNQLSRNLEYLKPKCLLASPQDDLGKELFSFLYKNRFYAITSENIQIVLQFFEKGFEGNKALLYSNIQASSLVELIDYIEANIELYLENIFLELEEIEVDIAILKLLNNEAVSLELKRKIIQAQPQFKISSLKESGLNNHKEKEEVIEDEE